MLYNERGKHMYLVMYIYDAISNMYMYCKYGVTCTCACNVVGGLWFGVLLKVLYMYTCVHAQIPSTSSTTRH